MVMEQHGVKWLQKGTHEKHLSVLDFEKQERAKEVAELDSQKQEKTSEVAKLNQAVSSMKQELMTTTIKQVRAEEAVEKARVEGIAVQRDNETLSASNQQLRVENTSLEIKKVELRTDNRHMEQQQWQLRTDNSELEMKHSVLQSEKPDFYSQMVKDDEFDNTEYASKIKWLARDNEDIYDPDYNDMLRVAFMYSFDRAKLADLVSLLSGRDFETREFKEDIVEDSYNRLREGIKQFINEHNFNQFVLAIKGAGYKSRKQLGSQMTLDFAYLLYLKLLNDSEIPHDQIKHHVQKWFVLSTLTGRYVGSPESVMSRDIRLMNEKGFINFFNEVESSVLSDTFWTITLPQNLETTSTNSPAFNTFLAAQVNMNCNSLFMHGTMISDLINISGDVHHIFPKAYLKRNGVEAKGRYNQVANYTYLDTQVNKAVRDDAPNIYFGKVIEQCENGNIAFGNISDKGTMMKNLEENAIPYDVVEMTIDDYDRFLEERRFLMAKLVERYYKSL